MKVFYKQLTKLLKLKTMMLPNGFFTNDMKVFVNVELPKSNPNRKVKVDNTFRAIYQSVFDISVDNSKVKSHNVNIDYPVFFCLALTEKEAINKMIKSDFPYKHLPIFKINRS